MSPPGSSVHGILQARTLEWVAISFSRTHRSQLQKKRTNNTNPVFTLNVDVLFITDASVSTLSFLKIALKMRFALITEIFGVSSSFAIEDGAALSPLPVRAGGSSPVPRKAGPGAGRTGLPQARGCLPRLFCVPCFLARLSSLWMRPSRYSCFLPSISSVSRSRARASWALGAARLLEEPPPLKNLPNLLMVLGGRAAVRHAIVIIWVMKIFFG